MSEAGKIACEACGRQFAWKPELAGKKVKCKCGASFAVPQEAPETEAAPPEEFGLDDMGAATAATPPPYARAAAVQSSTPTKAGKAPRQAAAKAAPVARGGKRNDDEAKRNEIKKVVMIAVGLVLVIGLVIGGKYAISALGHEEPKNLPGMDGGVANLIKDDGGYEVLQWLKEGRQRGVVGFFWTREKTQAKAQEWYDNGAKKVLAFGGVMTRVLAIELPDDPAKRKYFFEYAELFRQDNHPERPAQTDVKQKYVVIEFM